MFCDIDRSPTVQNGLNSVKETKVFRWVEMIESDWASVVTNVCVVGRCLCTCKFI